MPLSRPVLDQACDSNVLLVLLRCNAIAQGMQGPRDAKLGPECCPTPGRSTTSACISNTNADLSALLRLHALFPRSKVDAAPCEAGSSSLVQRLRHRARHKDKKSRLSKSMNSCIRSSAEPLGTHVHGICPCFIHTKVA